MNTTANPSELKPTDPRLKNRLNMRIFTTKDRFLGWLDDTMSTDIKKLAERQALLDSFDEILLVAIDAFNLAHDAEVVGAPKRTPDEIDALGMQVIEFSGLFQHYKDQMFSLFNSAASGKQSPNSSGSKDGHAPPGDSLMLNNDALHAFRKAREHLYKLLSKTPKQASIDKKWNYIPGTDFKGDSSYLKRIIEYRKYQNSRELVGLNINQQIYTALSNIPNYGFDSWRQDATTDNTDDLDIIE